MESEVIEGLAALEEDLAQLPNRIAKGAVQRVLRRGGEVIRSKWESLARQRTGKFKLSIAVSSRIERAVKHFQASASAPAAVAYVGPTHDGYPEAMMEEFGAHSNHHNEAANAPGRRAWDSEAHAALDVIAAELGPEIAKTQMRFFKRRG